MHLIIGTLIEVLSTLPGLPFSSGSLGVRQPSSSNEIPAVVLSFSVENVRGTGIGRFIRAGDALVQHIAILEVRATPETFSSDLRFLLLRPLPLRKHPASTQKTFTENDVHVSNVTDPAQPIAYWMIAHPLQKETYILDIPRAQIRFGAAQVAGERLEVVHWTLTWRDDILGDRYSGSMAMEIWASSFNEADELSQRLHTTLPANRMVLRQKGFMKLQLVGLGSIEQVLHTPSVGSPFAVWKQRLSYQFVFESEAGGALSEGVPIKRIDVDVDEHLNESFVVS